MTVDSSTSPMLITLQQHYRPDRARPAAAAAAGAAAHFLALRDRRDRHVFYAMLAVLGFLGTTVVTVGRMETFRTAFYIATGDGKDYYVYLPSVLVDHDLDLSNQMLEH